MFRSQQYALSSRASVLHCVQNIIKCAWLHLLRRRLSPAATGELANNASPFNAVSYEFSFNTTDQLPRLFTNTMQHIFTFQAIVTNLANVYSKNIKFNIKFAVRTIRKLRRTFYYYATKIVSEVTSKIVKKQQFTNTNYQRKNMLAGVYDFHKCSKQRVHTLLRLTRVH